VAGLSPDPPESHARFGDKLGLTYPLLADPHAGLIQALGAWGQKQGQGGAQEGPVRSTYVAGSRGRVERVYPEARAGGHAAQVLADLRAG
jgi:peroxiredoxin Q/BCP